MRSRSSSNSNSSSNGAAAPPPPPKRLFSAMVHLPVACRCAHCKLSCGKQPASCLSLVHLPVACLPLRNERRRLGVRRLGKAWPTPLARNGRQRATRSVAGARNGRRGPPFPTRGRGAGRAAGRRAARSDSEAIGSDSEAVRASLPPSLPPSRPPSPPPSRTHVLPACLPAGRQVPAA